MSDGRDSDVWGDWQEFVGQMPDGDDGVSYDNAASESIWPNADDSASPEPAESPADDYGLPDEATQESRPSKKQRRRSRKKRRDQALPEEQSNAVALPHEETGADDPGDSATKLVGELVGGQGDAQVEQQWSRKEARRLAKETKKNRKESRRDQKTAGQELSRRQKGKDEGKTGDKQRKSRKVQQVKPDKKELRREKEQQAESAKRLPPRRKSTVVMVDGSRAVSVVLRKGRVVGAAEEEYAHEDKTVEMCSKFSASDRLVWCNEVDARNLVARTDADYAASAKEALTAQDLIDTFRDSGKDAISARLSDTPHEGHLSTVAFALDERWAKHRLMQRHKGRVVASPQCHGHQQGIWLWIGYAKTEAVYVADSGCAVEWSDMPSLEFPPVEVGGDPPDYGSGLDAMSKVAAAATPQVAAGQFVAAVTEYLSRLSQDWTLRRGPVEAVWVHGPGVRVPGMIDALMDKTSAPVSRPHVNALSGIASTDHLIFALNAWRQPPMRNQHRIIEQMRRRRAMKVVRRSAYGVAVIAAMVAASVYIGNRRQSALEAAQARSAAANAAIASTQEVAQPTAALSLPDAQAWMGCAQAAADIAAPGGADSSEAVAVPVGYDPSEWPDGWEQAVMSVRLPESIRSAGHAAVWKGASIAGADQAQIIAQQSVDGEIGSGEDADINAAFANAGLHHEAWRAYAWAQIHFSASDGRAYIPPDDAHALCATDNPDLLWKAQNAALMPVMLARQMQTYPGWDGIDEPSALLGSSVDLSMKHDSLRVSDMTVFGARLAHYQAIEETLRPLAIHLWGTHGDVKIEGPLSRRCFEGVDEQTGMPLHLCGVTTSVEIGPVFESDQSDSVDNGEASQ